MNFRNREFCFTNSATVNFHSISKHLVKSAFYTQVGWFILPNLNICSTNIQHMTVGTQEEPDPRKPVTEVRASDS